jgi:hypothetical protein
MKVSTYPAGRISPAIAAAPLVALTTAQARGTMNTGNSNGWD